jgi:hypothetical protein
MLSSVKGARKPLQNLPDKGGDTADDFIDPLGIGMNPVGLVEFGATRHPFQKIGIKRDLVFRRQAGKDRGEGGPVIRAQIP